MSKSFNPNPGAPFGERLSAVEQHAVGHAQLDDTRFEHIKTNLDAIWRRSGRMEVALWTAAIGLLAWSGAQLFHAYTGASAEARGHYEHIRGAVR